MNPSYNYDNRCEAAVKYLHTAMRALLKLFISKIVKRRKSQGRAEKGLIEETMRLVYYDILNAQARGATEEFTLKAAVGLRRRLVIDFLFLLLFSKDESHLNVFVGFTYCCAAFKN